MKLASLDKRDIQVMVNEIWPLLREQSYYLKVFEKIGEEFGEWQEELDQDQLSEDAFFSETIDLMVTSLSSPVCILSSGKDQLIEKIFSYIQGDVFFDSIKASNFEKKTDTFRSEFIKKLGKLGRKQRKWRLNPLAFEGELIDAGIALFSLSYLGARGLLGHSSSKILNKFLEKTAKWKGYSEKKIFLSDLDIEGDIRASKLGDFDNNLACIDHFDTQWGALSNFSMGELLFEGHFYPTLEHAYQAAKVSDHANRKIIREAKTPGEAKILGRRFHDKEDWDKVKLAIMEGLVRYKFSHNHYLKSILKLTGRAELIEGNSWGDRYWGVCEGVGENHLGRILMKIRAELFGSQS